MNQAPTDSELTKPLVVDLDGSLIKTDLLAESFWSAFARDWTTPLHATIKLMAGRATLKHFLADKADIDPALLPYNDEVISRISEAKQQGRKIILATASDQQLADQIANHLGLFDQVMATTPNRNLKAEAKAQVLVDQFGETGFSYIGDSAADLPVWAAAGSGLTVNASPALQRKASQRCENIEHLGTAPGLTGQLAVLAKAIRPHQWLKNSLIFLPMIAAHQLQPANWLLGVLAFVSFSLIASSVYLTNDLLDLDADRNHPRKRNRPFASGALPIASGMTAIPVLLIAGLSAGVALPPLFQLILAGYFLLTVAYSLYLKRRPIVDITTLAALYTLRIAAGGAATAIVLSNWLLAFSVFLFFSLAAVKRQGELADAKNRGAANASGRGYRTDDLSLVTQMATASGYVSVLVLALYLTSDQVEILYSIPELMWGNCLILLLWISHMIWRAGRGMMDDDPLVYAIKDNSSRICFLGVLLITAASSFL